jgi:TonB family protein
LGYYTANQNMDGKYREIKITRKDDTMAKLNYRAGYYADGGRAGVGQGGVDPNIDPDPALPVAIYKPEAQYSEEARKAKWQGTATLSVDVDPSGAATNIKVIRNLGLGLDEKAIEAVRQWKFEPGVKDGKPVTVPVQVEVIFRLL